MFELFLAPSVIKLNYEYEVIFKNGILNKKKRTEEKRVHNVRTWSLSEMCCPPKKKSKKGHCELCLSRHLTSEYDKTKYRKKLDAEVDLRLQLSRILRDLQLMCSATKPPPSH